MNDRLVAFLLARIEEERQGAQAAADAEAASWLPGVDVGDHMNTSTVTTAEGEEWRRQRVATCGQDYFGGEETAAHIARWDPARVLADCAARRRIVDRFVETAPPYASARQQEIHETLRDEVMEPLANVFRDHPDFDPSWRLES